MDFVEIRRKAKERVAARDLPPPPRAADPEPSPPLQRTERHDLADPEVGPSPHDLGLLAALAAGPELDALLTDVDPSPLPPAVEDRWTVPPTPAPTWPPAAPESPGEEDLDAAQWTVAAAPPPPPVAPAPAPRAAAASSDAADPLDEFFFDAGEEARALDLFAGDEPAAASAAEASEVRRELLGFRLGDEEYAVDIARVREVLKAPAITEVPRAPAHVLGVIMVRGEVIPVFDPRRRLGLPSVAPSRASRVLVCDAGESGSIGLLVDGVSQVVRLRRADVEPRPHGVGGAAADYIAGIGRDAGRLFILLDLRAILRGAPAKEARS